GDRVALLLPNSPQSIIAQLGAWKAGAIAAPINSLYTPRELEGALNEVGAETVVVLTPFYEKVKALQAEIASVKAASMGEVEKAKAAVEEKLRVLQVQVDAEHASVSAKAQGVQSELQKKLDALGKQLQEQKTLAEQKTAQESGSRSQLETVKAAVKDFLDSAGQTRLDKAATVLIKPNLLGGFTPEKAVTTHPKLSLGGVYIQTHQVATAGYCPHFNVQDGEELAINTSVSKIHFIERAIKAQRPIFLIASGNYEDYERENYDNLSELVIFKNEKIYIIISCFIPYGCEIDHSYEQNYIVYGGNSKIFIEPYVILNNKPGFKEFKKSYLTVGFTNCEKSPFAQILLNLGGFQLI
ncbi:MAG: AMP-binding protein, partial [Nostocales cyanobacterium W4_Combined_metabat2_030]|nr:AMP-binding protein [Nostocales cyanobacterium W4_Combined_metabat2_030]